MEVNDKLHTPNKELVQIEGDTRCVPEPVWTWRRRKKFFPLPRIESRWSIL